MDSSRTENAGPVLEAWLGAGIPQIEGCAQNRQKRTSLD
jgi:hypothetical protein